MIRRLLFLVLTLASASWAHAQTVTIAAGASTATINAAIQNAVTAHDSTVMFSAGTYNITTIGIPCPSVPLTVTGPVTTYPENFNARPTAILSNANTGESPQLISIPGGCTTAITIQYLECNGNQPTSGGGCVEVNEGGSTGNSNVTIQDNYFHGNQEITPTVGGTGPNQFWNYDDTNANLIRFDGSQGGPTDSNILITNNIFGNPTPGDCSNVMQFIGGNIEASGDNSTPTALVFVGYDQPGGNCSAIGVETSITNFTVSNNIIQEQEQGMKFFEGGGASPNLFLQTNVNIVNNDFGFIHRIGVENQGSPTTSITSGAVFNISNNDFHDWIAPSFGSWVLSMAACCLQPSPGAINSIGNVFIANTGPEGNVGPGTIEWWTGPNGQYANNFVQGNWNPGSQYGFYNPPIFMINNIYQLATAGASIINNEEGETETPITLTPNTSEIGVSMTPLTSAAPTISPNGGSFSGSQVVTITNPGNTSGTGPQGNTGSWCTQDGSNVTPKSGTAQYVASGGTLTIATPTTLKCAGMWGSNTQPGSYPSTYGFVPSSTVTAAFTCTTCGGGGGGTTPTLSSVALSGTSALIVGSTSQLSATGTLSNGTTESVTPTSWTSSNTAVATVSSSGLVTSVAVGTANITAVFSGITSSPLNVTVSANTPEGFFLGTTPTADVNTMTVGGSTLQFQTFAFFANGAPDALFTAGSYTSSNTAVCTVTSPGGLVTAVSAGTCNIQSSTSGLNSSPWTITVSAASTTPTTATPTFSPGQGTFTGSVSPIVSSATSGATVSCSANGGTATTGASPATFGPFTATTTLACTATAFGDAVSASATATYTLQSVTTPTTATPTFSPSTGTFTGSISPVVSSATSGATIACSANGTNLTPAASPATFGPFSATTVLVCSATASGDNPSASATATYTFSAATPVVATPTFNPGSETFSTSVSPVVSSTTAGAMISCTANGAPLASAASPATFGPFTGTTMLNCTATASGDTQSATATATYTLVSTAPTTTLTSTMTAAQIQTAINNTAAGGTVLFSAGTYSLSAPIALQCGLTYTGPAGATVFGNAFAPGQDFVANTPTQPTAILDSTQTGSNIFTISGCSSTGPTTTLEWVWGENTGLLYDDGSANNISVLHNWCTGVSPNTLNTGNPSSSCVFIDGDATGSSTSNILVSFNQLGDATSCGAVFALTPQNTGGVNPDGDEGPDWGGHCAGILVNTGVTNFTAENNFFYHMEELAKFHQAGSFGEGNPVTVCDNCTVRFNLFYEFKRIMVENQASVDVGANGFNLSDNAGGWGVENLGSSFGFSMACCQSNIDQTGPGADPADFVNDNLMVVSPDTEQGSITPSGCECWGVGLEMNNNFFEGQMFSYFLIGNGSSATGNITFGNPIWQANNNYICSDNNPFGFSFFNNEGEPQGPTSQSNTPTNLIFNGTGNPFTATAASGLGNTACTQQTSSPPTIAPNGGTFSGSQSVELNNAGENTTTYYTTDGSTPVPGQGTTKMFNGPFTITATTTVKAVGMWGQSPQPLSYIADKVDGTAFGFVPSGTVTATFTQSASGTVAAPTFNPGTENFTGSVSPVVSSATSGATIDCTANSSPVVGTGNPRTLGPFTVTTTVTCTATLGGVESTISSAVYTLSAESRAAAPTITPNGGVYQGTLNVSLTSTTPGAIFNCTTNGTTPTESSPAATGFTLTGSPASETISCIASANGFSASPVTTATFTASIFLGNGTDNSNGSTSENFFNLVYAVSGSNANGYTVSNCTVNQGAGAVTNGANTDCLLVMAPSGTTEAATPVCHGTFTNTSAVGVSAVISMPGCGTIPANTAFWVSSITNDPLGSSSLGFSDCPPSGCTGGVPTAGQNNGTYPGFFVAGTYGVYTAMPTALTEGIDQPSQFVTLTAIGAQTATPVFSPVSGTTFTTSQTVTITDATSGSSIFFCVTVGCTATPSSTQYTGPFSVSSTTTVTAIATSSGASQSAAASATYTQVTESGFNVIGSGAVHASGSVLAR